MDTIKEILQQLPVVQILLTLLLFAVYPTIKWSVLNLVQRFGDQKQVTMNRVEPILRYFRILTWVVALLVVMMIWGADYKGLLVFASSIVAVLGVALFAQWSILSNITAGVIVFFAFPARIGDRVEIIDGNASVQGEILEINMFQVILRDDHDEKIIYPNSLLLLRPVIKKSIDSKTRYKGDKTPDFDDKKSHDTIGLAKRMASRR